MHLINSRSLRLETFMRAEEDVPPYAILSHTWSSKSEILFEDMCNLPLGQLRDQPAFAKVERSCLRARQDGFDYIWVDNCCIDRRSSSELSEAINSMFRWYQQSSICYAYLEDFEVDAAGADADPGFCSARWFDRGWTLQELIAPRKVVFFDKNWVEFGARDGRLFRAICERTGIMPEVFASRHCQCPSRSDSILRNGKCTACNARDNLPDLLGSLNACAVLSWAAGRSTTRKEDTAYSLMGLFGINMPLLYGEGDKAFMRLQSAILKQSSDRSILLWRAKPDPFGRWSWPGCLAPSPKAFEFPPPIAAQRVYYDHDNEVTPRIAAGPADDTDPIEVSDTILRTSLWLCPCRVDHSYARENSPQSRDWVLGILNCGAAADFFMRPAILLSPMGSDLYRRIACDAIFLVNPRAETGPAAAATLSVYNRQPNAPDPDSGWMIVQNISISEATRSEIKLLVRPSGPSLLRREFGTHDTIHSSSDPVCSVINQLQYPTMTSRLVGGYPTMYSADTCPQTMPMLRGLVSFGSHNDLRLIGGIHLFELGIPATSAKVGLYVLWGLHQEPTTRRGDVSKQESWKSWCRVFDAASFSRQRDIPLRDEADAADRPKLQKQLFAWLSRKSKELDWTITDATGGRKKVLPDTSHAKWTADRIVDLLAETKHRVGLSARMNVVQGLGRVSYDVEMTFLTPECRGWQGESFNGSREDQEPVTSYHGKVR